MKILLVEDSHLLQRSLSAGLRNLGNTIDQAFDGHEALQHIHSSYYDLIILDLMLPKKNGLEVLLELRKSKVKSLVLILSAKDQVEDRIAGLDAGADDYLVKPFSFDELQSRIRALERRSKENTSGHDNRLVIGNVSIDLKKREVIIGDQLVTLTPLEYSLLELLATRKSQIFSHDHLIDRLYSNQSNVTRNAVEAHVSGLRRKLKSSGAENIISTRRGFGYYIE